VIEKVETHSDVGFAVILLTPDDEGVRGELTWGEGGGRQEAPWRRGAATEPGPQ
jgi:hypothetical protein